MRYLILGTLLFVGCQAPNGSPLAPGSTAQVCKGVYYLRDSSGALKKYNQYDLNGQCVTDNMPLSQWETSTESRAEKGTACTPQNLSITLISANNFYSYRDGKIYLDLNGNTGEYRKLTLAEGKDGKQVFTRLQGCFYVRTDPTFGRQLLLDIINTASDQAFDAMEIFTFTTTGNSLQATRFDDSSEWTYQECPILDTPDSFCALLRNGNEVYFPNLTAAQQASVLSEAILIRKQFNYDTTSLSTFNSLWNNPTQDGRVAEVREDYKYAVQTIVDDPRYIDQAWAAFVRGTSNLMPDITSSTMPPVCYDGSQTVTLANGNSGKTYGEVCYDNGTYTFN